MKVLTQRLWPFFSFFPGSCWVAALLLAPGVIAAPRCAQAAERTRTAAQKQADAAVHEALQREVYGLEADRQELLSAAVSLAPNHAAARWQQGYVRSAAGKWLRAESAVDKQRQALLARYEERRQKEPDWIGGQMALADWCRDQGLHDQERAHLMRVCELAPDHPDARERLGFVRQGVDWITREELVRQEDRKAAEKEALEKWQPAIESLVAQTAAEKPRIRRLAMEQLRQIRDPAALPALHAVLNRGGEEWELLAVEITAQMTDPAAALMLAQRGVRSSSQRVRRQAAGKLAHYDSEHYVPQLVAAMFMPITSRYEAVERNGVINYRHQFTREALSRHETIVFDADYRRDAGSGDRRLARATALNNAAETALQREQQAKAQNETIREMNERIAFVLRTTTGAELPAVPQEWWNWWTKQNEVFVAGQKPIATVTHLVSFDVRDYSLSSSNSSTQESLSSPIQPRYDCLAAGTPVWTEQGMRSIEQVRVGDLVLSRDVESGELAFKPVIRTTVRPPGQLVRVRVGSETFETSSGHLFWVSGEGWKKSRELQSGMVLHTAGGPARVTEVDKGGHAQTYNLIVDGFSTYFVGEQKVLSHDNTVRRPTQVVVPGLKVE